LRQSKRIKIGTPLSPRGQRLIERQEKLVNDKASSKLKPNHESTKSDKAFKAPKDPLKEVASISKAKNTGETSLRSKKESKDFIEAEKSPFSNRRNKRILVDEKQNEPDSSTKLTSIDNQCVEPLKQALAPNKKKDQTDGRGQKTPGKVNMH